MLSLPLDYIQESIEVSVINCWFCMIFSGFASMLPRSTESSDGNIGLWDWMKIGVKYRQTPTFCPLQVSCMYAFFHLIFMGNNFKLAFPKVSHHFRAG